jgi:hypothetical protein
MLFSTFLTLVLVPVLYAILSRFVNVQQEEEKTEMGHGTAAARELVPQGS